jgi:hypothetical protein
MAMNKLSRSAVQDIDWARWSTTASRPAVPEPRYSDCARSVSGDPLGSSIQATYDVAMRKLGELEPTSRYKAVARLSGHLAAMHRAVYPMASQRLGKDGQLLTACRDEARQVAWALRFFECHIAGEAGAASRDMQTVRAWLNQCLEAFRSAERELVAEMDERLTVPERERLARGYRAALAGAPTRPHPRGPHAGWPGKLGFRLHAFWDGVLDTVDSRPGVGRPADTPSARWASYAEDDVRPQIRDMPGSQFADDMSA